MLGGVGGYIQNVNYLRFVHEDRHLPTREVFLAAPIPGGKGDGLFSIQPTFEQMSSRIRDCGLTCTAGLSESLCSDRYSGERVPDTAARAEEVDVGTGCESTSLR